MANRIYTQFRSSLEKKVVDVFATVDFADTSAPIVKKFSTPLTGGAGSYATTTAAIKGLVSVARTAQGKYTFTFEDRFTRLLGLKVTPIAIDATTSPKALSWFVMSDTFATTKTLVVGFTATPNSATLVDLGANDRLAFTFTLSDSTAQ
jgi:hypothetical protein